MTDTVDQTKTSRADGLQVIQQQPGPPAVEGLPPTPPDDDVRRDIVCAVALGWATTTVYRVCARPVAEKGEPAYLPTEAELTPLEAARRYVERVVVGVERMRSRLSPELVQQVTAMRDELGRPDRAEPLADVQPVLRELHVAMLSLLAASDARVGKGYALGAALARVADQLGEASKDADSDRDGGGRRLKRGRVDRQYATLDGQREELLRIHDQVRDLATVLPDHVGQPVRESIARWLSFMDGERRLRRTGSERDEVLVLQRQVFLWKAVLVQEKDAMDSLSATDVLQVSVDAMRGLMRQAVLTLRAMGGIVLLVILLGGGALTAYAIGQSQTGTASAAIVSTVGGLVATSWRAGRSKGAQYVDELRVRIQGSVEDAAIARALTLLPADAVRRQVKRDASKQVLVPGASGSVASQRG